MKRRDALQVGFGSLAALVAANAGWGKAEAGESTLAKAAKPIRLTLQETELVVLGRNVKVLSILNSSGSLGYSPEQSAGFHVEVVNKLPVPSCVHWHGIILPNPMDGVPFVTQKPIPPGRSYRYNFPLKQAGTYWMHSHYGMQEQHLLAAPMVIWTPEERAKASRQYVVSFSDFSFTPPEKILANLRKPAPMAMTGMQEKHDMQSMQGPAAVKVLSQQWNQVDQSFEKKESLGNPAKADVVYDALLANRRTIDNPELLAVSPGETVLLRLIASSCATNFYIDTGTLTATISATDGNNTKPVVGNYFQLAVAQRLDLLVTIPAEGGAFPILAQSAGRTLQAAVVLVTPGASAPSLPVQALVPTATLDGLQDLHLEPAVPLGARPIDRELDVVLGGSMQGYRWMINDFAYPNHESLVVKHGERVALRFKNTTAMSHPMHLHGHVFQVVEMAGSAINGPLRDTILVPPMADCLVVLDANQPGVWAFHCHIFYHAISGMFTVLRYEGNSTKEWRPDLSAHETSLKL